MTEHLDRIAWNNFVMHSDPMGSQIDPLKRAAAVANCFMGGANNGGINSFLTSTPELGSQEVLGALDALGAKSAAKQLGAILTELGEPLAASSAEVRWQTLDRLWSDRLDDFDILSEQADVELIQALESHVRENTAYYLALVD